MGERTEAVLDCAVVVEVDKTAAEVEAEVLETAEGSAELDWNDEVPELDKANAEADVVTRLLLVSDVAVLEAVSGKSNAGLIIAGNGAVEYDGVA